MQFSRSEAGESFPNAAEIIVLAKVLQVSGDSFLFGKAGSVPL
jgi:hypothetical protein